MKVNMTMKLDSNMVLMKTKPVQAQPTLQPSTLFGTKEISKTFYMRLETALNHWLMVSKVAALLPCLTQFIVQRQKVVKKNLFKQPLQLLMAAD